MSRYITRERVHIDRIATAWALKRFVDPEAVFAFVARERDPHELDGIAFDMRGADLSHRDGRITFEVLIARERLAMPGLARMAAIVRSVDLDERDDELPETAGVRAIFDGIRDALEDDAERLRVGFAICDALLAYCRAG
ncbi:MAG TPA: chromate resistance protein ChrB domain-containing protein [Candidatus Acidoferrales bacterium]|nr:chromate resistance protein ChrB domain-containing protein [Candidatus Acidoferrales bacterium]